MIMMMTMTEKLTKSVVTILTVTVVTVMVTITVKGHDDGNLLR